MNSEQRPDQLRGDDENQDSPDESGEIIARLTAERDEALGARTRALADFRNYQRRAAESEMRTLQTGAAGLARSLVPVLDHFDFALNQDVSRLSVEQLLRGVRIVRDELAKALESNGISRIEPKPDETFDPTRHEAMLRQVTEGVSPGNVAACFQAGYAMGDIVLRPAKVSVAGE